MSCTLYTWAGNTFSQAVEVTAKLSNHKLSVSDLVPGSAPEGFPAYASAPSITTEDGQKLTQFSAILNHISGQNDIETTELISIAELVLKPAMSAWVYPTLGAMPNNKQNINEGKKALLSALNDLNSKLASKTFLVGERPSAADAAMVAALVLAFKQVLAEQYRTNFPHVTRWFNTCVNHPDFTAFGSVTLCEKEAGFDSKTFAELNKKGGNNAKKDTKKDNKQKAAAPKKAEKKPENTEDDAPQFPKSKDPWEGLGGKYDMDAWKRCYSNNDTVPVAMKYFWEHMDAENYSCWFGKYRYGDEIGQVFMASNLVRGMFQRIDKMRKHSFGSVLIIGGQKPNDIEIEGVWFWKGQDIAFKLCNDWTVDYDGYDWKKIDTSTDEGKSMVQTYFSWEGPELNGREVADGKVYK